MSSTSRKITFTTNRSVPNDSLTLLVLQLRDDILGKYSIRISKAGEVWIYENHGWKIGWTKISEFESAVFTGLMEAEKNTTIIVTTAKGLLPGSSWINWVATSVVRALTAVKDTDSDAGNQIEQLLAHSKWVSFQDGVDLTWDASVCDWKMELADPDHFVTQVYPFASPSGQELNDFDLPANRPQLYLDLIERLYPTEEARHLTAAYGGAVLTLTQTRKAKVTMGLAGNGKSQEIVIFEKLLNPTMVTTIKVGKDESEFSLESLATSRFVTQHEAGRLKNTESWKSWVAGDATSINRKGRPILTIKPCVNVMMASNNTFSLEAGEDPRSVSQRFLVLQSTGSGIRGTAKDVDAWGEHIARQEGRKILIYTMGIWRMGQECNAHWWREWCKPALELSYTLACDGSPDLRYLQDHYEITGNPDDKVWMCEFASEYKSHRDEQGRSNFEYGESHALRTWRKQVDNDRVNVKRSTYTSDFAGEKIRKSNMWLVTGARKKVNVSEDLI